MNALEINNPDGEFVTYKQMAEKCNLSIEMTRKIAMEAQAVISIAPRVKRIDAQKFRSYLREKYTVKSAD